jgi:beta-xylosidase
MKYTQFEPGALWLDDKGTHINAHGGGMLFHEGTYYWFGEHKIGGTAGNVSHVGVHVYASEDLYNWRDAGIALKVSDDPKHDIGKLCAIERPKVLYNAKTKKFVMWFHLERVHLYGDAFYRDALSGVAVADAPAGPYRYLHTVHPNPGAWPKNLPKDQQQPLDEKEKSHLAKFHFNGGEIPKEAEPIGALLCRRDFERGQMARDMSLFLDDDGTGYHIHSSEENSTLHISKLSDDFLHSAGEYVRLFPGRFHEGPALMKRNGRYYLFSSWCTGWTPNPGRLAVADSIFGPWTELENPCVGSEAEKANTFESQSTYVLPVAGHPDTFIFMADRWRPENAIDGRYIWLPIQFRADGTPFLEWRDKWKLEAI